MLNVNNYTTDTIPKYTCACIQWSLLIHLIGSH